MPLRIAQATNPQAVWNEMQTEYHNFLNDRTYPWTYANFHYRRPRDASLQQLKTLSTLKVYIKHISGDHYYVYLLGTAEAGGQVKIAVGDLMQ
jgi:hypothetical protein